MVKLRWLKEWRDMKVGDVSEAGKKSAFNFVDQGFAEYINEEPKEENKDIIYGCTTCQNTTKIDIDKEIPQIDCCDKPNYFVIVLGNDGNSHRITIGEFLSYKNNNLISFEGGNYILNIYKNSKENQAESKDEILENLRKEKIKETEERLKDKRDLFIITRTGKKAGDIEKVYLEGVIKKLRKKYIFKTIFGKRSETLYVYDDGIYSSEISREKLQTTMESWLGAWCRRNIVDEAIAKIKRQTAVSLTEFEEGRPLHLIPLLNGLFNVETGKLESFSPEYYFTKKHPFNYVEKIDCPTFSNFINSILPESDIDAVQEFLGFCLYRRYLLKKCVVFVGGADTGKTTLLNVFVSVIGKDNTAGLDLSSIASGDRMRLYFLKDKTLNFYDDLAARDIIDAGGLKIATGGGYITAEEKFGEVSQFLSFAKLLFACNKIPILKEDDPAYFSRWMPFQFLNSIPKEEQNPELSYLIAEEVDSIGSWALQGLIRLLKNKQFSYKKTDEEIKLIMKSGDPLARFVSEVLEEEEGSKISKEEMYQIYSRWAKDNDLTRMTKEMLGRNLERACPFVHAINENKVRYWSGVRINTNNNTLYTLFKNIREHFEKEIKKHKNNDKNDDNEIVDVSKRKAVYSVLENGLPNNTLYPYLEKEAKSIPIRKKPHEINFGEVFK